MTIDENIVSEYNILAINFENGQFGASVFINNELKILTEDENRINRDLIDWISAQEARLKVLLSSRSNINALKQCLPSCASIQLLPATEFSLLNAEYLQDEYCLNINLEFLPSNESCFKSLHALLAFLSMTLPETDRPNQVTYLHLESTNVIIGKSCLQALQIFDYEPHPNMHANNQGFKEGCSIFSLFNQVVSEEGRVKLKKWFHNPTNNTQILKSRLDSIEALIKTEMNSFIKSVTKSLKKSIRISVKLNCFVFESKTLLL